jgi:hypothetical protein
MEGPAAGGVCGLLVNVDWDTLSGMKGDGENRSDMGFILPGASKEMAIVGSVGTLRCQEAARLRLELAATPLVVRYACTAGPRELTTTLIRSAVGLALKCW